LRFGFLKGLVTIAKGMEEGGAGTAMVPLEVGTGLPHIMIRKNSSKSNLSLEMQRTKLTFRAFLNPRSFICFVAMVLFIAGYSFLLVSYENSIASGLLFRVVLLFARALLFVAIGLAGTNIFVYVKATKGDILEKPFERPIVAKSRAITKCKNMKHRYQLIQNHIYEVFNTNGKFYLWRLYGAEVIESLYQIFNLNIYACVLTPVNLLVHCLIMASESMYRMYRLRDLDGPIDNRKKKVEVLVDSLIELFCMSFPLVSMYYFSKVFLKDEDVIQILSVPSCLLMLKIRMVWKEEILLALDNIRIEKALEGLDETERRTRRRSSFSARERTVLLLQNKYFSKTVRKCVLVFTALITAFYVSIAGVQVASIFMKVPEYFDAYCDANVPTCTRWFSPTPNCLKIHYFNPNPKHFDDTLAKFRSNSATLGLEASGLASASVLDGAFPNLRKLHLTFGNMTHFSADIKQWKDLVNLKIASFEAMETLHSSLFDNQLRNLFLSNMPLVENVPDSISLHPDIFMFDRVGKTIPSAWTLPEKMHYIQISGYNITRLPKGIESVELEEGIFSNNNLTTCSAVVKHAIDLRFNNIPLGSFPTITKGEKYAHGNRPGCPGGWNCTPFCSKECWSAEYKKTSSECYVECIDSCGVATSCSKYIKE
jgi:hypothetical protein